MSSIASIRKTATDGGAYYPASTAIVRAYDSIAPAPLPTVAVTVYATKGNATLDTTAEVAALLVPVLLADTTVLSVTARRGT